MVGVNKSITGGRAGTEFGKQLNKSGEQMDNEEAKQLKTLVKKCLFEAGLIPLLRFIFVATNELYEEFDSYKNFFSEIIEKEEGHR